MSDSIEKKGVLLETNSLDDDQSASDTNTITSTQSSIESEYEVGDIVWTKIGKYPFWPSVICMDPQSKTYINSDENKKNINVHVRFCNDKGRRSWAKNIIRYRGKDDLLEKYPNNLSYVQNRQKLKDAWNKAVEEADNLVKLERTNRAITFFKTFSNLNPFDVSARSDLNTSSVQRRYSTKRSATTSDHEHVSKIFKTVDVSLNNSDSTPSEHIDIRGENGAVKKRSYLKKNPRKRKLNENIKNKTNSSEGPSYTMQDMPYVERSSTAPPLITEQRLRDISALEENDRTTSICSFFKDDKKRK